MVFKQDKIIWRPLFNIDDILLQLDKKQPCLVSDHVIKYYPLNISLWEILSSGHIHCSMCLHIKQANDNNSALNMWKAKPH